MLINNVYFSCLSCHVKDCKNHYSSCIVLCCCYYKLDLWGGTWCTPYFESFVFTLLQMNCWTKECLIKYGLVMGVQNLWFFCNFTNSTFQNGFHSILTSLIISFEICGSSIMTTSCINSLVIIKYFVSTSCFL
jgi:hypothetical protein